MTGQSAINQKERKVALVDLEDSKAGFNVDDEDMPDPYIIVILSQL